MRACADTFANLAASGTRARARRQSSLASRGRVAVAAPLARASRVAPRGRGRGAALAIRAAGTIQKVTKSELEEVMKVRPVSYTHLRAHETREDLVCRLLLEKKKK